MPVYEYDCPDCGSFETFRSLEDRNEPSRCPHCEQPATRMLSVPRLAVMNPANRKAHALNEKSRHEPRVGSAHRCSTGCGCATKGSGARVKERPLRARDARPKRPWMLGH